MAKLEKRQVNSCFPLQCLRSRLSLLLKLSLVVGLYFAFWSMEPLDEKTATSSTLDEKQVREEEVANGKEDGQKDDRSASPRLKRLMMKRMSPSLWNRPTNSEKRKSRSQSSDCGVPDFMPKTFPRIVGGVEATPHSWPWQADVQILHQNNWHHWCGGIVLSPTWIITAAHCTYGLGLASNFKVRLGAHDRVRHDETEQVFDVERIVMHAEYHSVTNDNDIALLRLPTKAQFNSYVKPICLPDVDVGENFLCVVSGWGSTQGTALGNETALQQVYVPVIGHSQCNQTDWYNGRITENMFCAGYPDGRKDSCQGDSGGPLVCRSQDIWKLFGVTSFGDGCAVARRPGVYTRISKYLAWLKEKTEGQH